MKYLLSVKSNLQHHYHFKPDFPKVDVKYIKLVINLAYLINHVLIYPVIR